MNVLSWTVLGIVATGVAAALRCMHRNKSAGCCGACAGCLRKCSESEHAAGKK